MGRKPGNRKKFPIEYRAYHAAKTRCNTATHKMAYRYSGRVEFRFNSFEEFYEHLGPRPDGHELDRIDNDGHYEVGNVQWVTREQNLGNRSVTIKLTYKGETKPLSVWAKELGLDYYRTRARYKAGWPAEKILLEQDQRETRRIK